MSSILKVVKHRDIYLMTPEIFRKIQKADMCMHQKKFSSAALLAKEAVVDLANIDDAENLAYAHYLLGVARLKCFRLHLAKESLEMASRILPQKPENLRTLGWAEVMLGDLEQGRKHIQESINMDMTYTHAYVDLAMSYIHYFEFEKGKELLETAASLDPEDTFVKECRGIVAEMEGEFGKLTNNKRERLRKEKLDPKLQREFRIMMLEQFLQQNQTLHRSEVGEITEELHRNGLSGAVEYM